MVGVCCRCGREPYNSPYCINKAPYKFHCFCCSKTPPERCYKCNVGIDEEHGLCTGGEPHTFVDTETWPPFAPESTNFNLDTVAMSPERDEDGE